MKNKNNFLPKWISKIAVLLVVIGFWGFVPKPSSDSLKPLFSSWFPEKNYQQIEVALEPNKWSDWITVPAGSSYRIDTSVPVEVCFIDNPECDSDKTFTVYPSEYKKPTWLGLTREAFKIWASEPATVTVTIERQ